MSVTLPTKWKPEKSIAIDLLVTSPESSIQDVADKAGVTTATIRNWFKDAEFVEIFYQKYMVTFGARLPSVLNSMVREAEAGNVQAGRLVLEHSGKLIKRVEVSNHQSPFEKFLNTQVPEEAEVVEYDEVEIMPQRPVVPEKPVKETPQSKKKLKKKNKKRREARQWRARAKKVGVDTPSQGRQTPRQRKEWQEKIVKREKSLNIKVL